MPDHPHPDPMVYFAGELMPAREARLPIDDRAVQFGLGFFETFRTAGGHPHLWPYHRRRLEEACATGRLELPAHFLVRDERRLQEDVRQLLEANGMPEAVFRYTVTGGPEPGTRPGGPVESLVARPLPLPPPAEGVTLRVLNLPRDGGEWLPRPKSLNYSNALLGRNELRRRATAPDDEGLFLARDSALVVETTQQNIAWIAGSELFYPDPSLGGVAGTGLAWLLADGEPAIARRAPVDELLCADAVFVLNSVRGVTPVRRICDARDEVLTESIRSAAHPRVQTLQERWTAALAKTSETPLGR